MSALGALSIENQMLTGSLAINPNMRHILIQKNRYPLFLIPSPQRRSPSPLSPLYWIAGRFPRRKSTIQSLRLIAAPTEQRRGAFAARTAAVFHISVGNYQSILRDLC